MPARLQRCFDFRIGRGRRLQGEAVKARIRAEAFTAGTLGGFALDDPGVVLLGRETTLRDEAYAGYLTSEGFGYTVGRPVGYGYVRNTDGATEQWVRVGRYELVVAGERVSAQVHLGPLYDPDGARFRS